MKKINYLVSVGLLFSLSLCIQAEPAKKYKNLMFMDKDRNGVISFSEFSSRSEKMFSFLDQNSDGNITRLEMDGGENLRKEKMLPPFFKLISLTISGKNKNIVNKHAIDLKYKIPKMKDVDILGPVDTPIFKLKKNYRSRILIRYPKSLFVQKYLSSLIKNLKFPYGIKLGVDVDPINFA